MTDAGWQAIATIVGSVMVGIPATIGAIAGLASLRRGNSIYAQNTAQATKADSKADKIIEATTAIHTLTNSTLSTTQAALSESAAKNAGLERLVGVLTTPIIDRFAPPVPPPAKDPTV